MRNKSKGGSTTDSFVADHPSTALRGQARDSVLALHATSRSASFILDEPPTRDDQKNRTVAHIAGQLSSVQAFCIGERNNVEGQEGRKDDLR